MPYYRIRFTCRGEGEVIYLADDEAEAKAEFQNDIDNCELLRAVIDNNLTIGDFEFESVEPIGEEEK